MKAIRFDGKVALTEIPTPANEDEALIRVSRVGICNTDIEIVQGYAGFRGTLGHEFVGIVESAPDHEWIGKRVVGEINAGCGVCDLCRQHDPRHCRRRTVLGIVNRDGAMAEYLALPTQNLLEVPNHVSDEVAAFTEPLAAACEILEQLRIDAGDRVAVIGDGKLGLLIAQVVATTGCALTQFGRHTNKLAISALRGIRTQVVTEETAFHYARGFDIVIEASGAAAGFSLAQELVRPRGTIVLKSTIHGAVPFDAALIIVNEITLIGSRCGRFADALCLLAENKVDVSSLVSRVFPLSEAIAALDYAQAPGVLKVQLEP